MIILASEDIFLYQCNDKFLPNREAISELIKSIAAVPGMEFIQPAHAALAPVVCDPEMIEEIGPVLREKSYWITNGTRHSSVEVGMETGSIRLMKKYMPRKMLPFKPEEWHDVVTKAIEIMNENYIWPLATLIVGLPEETEKDTVKVVNSHPENRKYGLPTVMATIILIDPRTGAPKAIMGGTWITALRTGAAGAIATKYLANPNPKTVGFVGAGTQARTQLMGLQIVFKTIEEVRVWT